MENTWPVQNAKARFSELLRAAEAKPQKITRHGEEVGVLVSAEEFRRLTAKPGHAHKVKDIADALRICPRVPEFELPPRGHEPMRRVDFG